MKLLLPLDGSESAEKTLEWAMETFDKAKSEYYLLTVIPVIPDMIRVEYDISDATQLLKKAKERLESAGCKVTKSSYILGDPEDQICHYADEIEADQVVLGSHGRTGLAKLFMGSTSVAVLEHCKRPVVIHRNVAPKAEHQPMPANTLL